MTFTWLTGAVIAALVAAVANLIATYISVHKNDKRAAEDRVLAEKTRDLIDARERGTDRHKRFANVVEQLASNKGPVRMGALYTLSALADEWSRDAKRIVDATKTPQQLHQESEHRRYLASKINTAEKALTEASERYLNAANSDTSPKSDPLKIARNLASEKLAMEKRAYRSSRILILEEVEDAAKNSVAQRDSCISLLCAYLREFPRSVDSLEQKPARTNPVQTSGESTADQYVDTKARVDHEARLTAIAILKKHLSEDAQYPWPGNIIDLNGARLQYANLQGVHLEGAHLDGARLQHAKLDGSHFSEARMSRAKLDYAWLNDADLQKANLTRTHLNNVKARRCDFRGANLAEARLRKAQLFESNFEGAQLWKARLEGASMWFSSIKGAALYDATMIGAELVGADLRKATFTGANLEEVNLNGAIMGSPQTQDEVAIATSDGWATHGKVILWDSKTTWPKAFSVTEVINRQKQSKYSF